MARFLGVAVQTDIVVTVPEAGVPAASVVTFFAAADLVSCVALHSPTEPESVTVQVRRDDPRAAEITLGRVLRLTHEGGTGDTEWDITAIEDTSAADVLTVHGTAILMRLARVIYMGTDATNGNAVPDWTGVELTATEWLDLLVIPQLAAAGIPFELGTVDNTTARFTMEGEWTSVLEIVRAIAEPGRAAGEVRLSAGGDYGYVLDVLDAIGSSAATVRVRTAVNLIETKRERSLADVATRMFARGSSDSVATRTMADHLWRIASVVSGTVLELEDPAGGAGPVAYDDQWDGFYLAVMNSQTFASSAITDSVASTQRVTIASTAGMTAGDLVRFYAGSGENAARVTSVTHPTLVLHPALGGYGDRALILDRPAIVADANLAINPMMREWTVAADPPDGWTEFCDDASRATFAQELADGPSEEMPSFRVTISAGDTVFGAFTGTAQEPALTIQCPISRLWESATAGRRMYTASVWVKVVNAPAGTKIWAYLRNDADAATWHWDSAIHWLQVGQWTQGTDDEDVWVRLESAATDGGSAMDASGVRLCIEVGTDDAEPTGSEPVGTWAGAWDAGTAYSGGEYVSHGVSVYYCIAATTGDTPPNALYWDEVNPAPARRVAANFQMLVSAVTIAESATPIADREWSGGTALWQEANAELPNAVNAIKGYDLTVADLAADDGTTYATLAFTPGGLVEVTDTDLGVVTSLRLVEYTRDYLRPLSSGIRVGSAPERMTALTDELRPNGVFR